MEISVPVPIYSSWQQAENQTKIMKEYPKKYLYRQIIAAKIFIDDNFEKNIDVSQISNKAYFSKFHFIRLFKKIYGKTPYKYLTKVRIENAEKLLKKGMSVTNVCFAVGFDSVSSFSGLFKRTTGLSPSDYSSNQIRFQTQIQQTPLKFVPGCFATINGWIKSNFEENKNVIGN